VRNGAAHDARADDDDVHGMIVEETSGSFGIGTWREAFRLPVDVRLVEASRWRFISDRASRR
jgi:hypothetical protein